MDDRDDLEFEPEEESGIKPDTEKLKKKLKQCQNDRQEYLDGWQRARAELLNAKKEFEVSRTKIIERANENLIEDLIPVVESFRMAFANEESWQKIDKEWRTGVEYIYSQLIKTLKEYGLDLIEPIEGEPFDIEKHHSVGTKETDDASKDEHIATTQQAGYELNGQVLKPANVIIYQINH